MGDIKGELADLFLRLLKFESPTSRDNRDLLEWVASEARAKRLEPVVHGAEGALTAVHGEGGVLFSGHLDTVPRGTGWTRGLGERIAGRIYGRGSADMKGGCAAALWAAGRLASRGIPCGIIFTTDEETGMKGARKLASQTLLREAQAIVVGEPTRNRIATQEKGVYWVRVRTWGRAAHGSMTSLGDNAILKMVRLLATVADLERPQDYLREPTANVGEVHGGTAPNVVASQCDASIDIRFPPSCNFEDIKELLGRRLANASVSHDVEVVQTLPAVQVDPNESHVRALQRAGGGDLTVMAYATEMAVFHAVNPRMAILGPGEPTLAHTADEYVDWSEVVAAAEIYERFAASLIQR